MPNNRGPSTRRQEPEAGKTESLDPGLIAPPSISLPKGGGAIRGIGEKFAANPVTGTGSMSVPLMTSQGRSGFGPQLSLTYDSGAGNGPFGLGWTLSLPSITRKTDKGLPRYEDTDDSDVFILSGSEDLVPEFRKDATTGEWVIADGNFVREEISVDGYLVRRYRPRIEGLFARIERWTSQTDLTDVFWRSISKDNVTTWYGKTEKSRIADPSNPTHVFSWLISESYDDKGNAISYQYETENSDAVEDLANEKNRSRSAQRYIKRIKYCNRTPRTSNEVLSQRTDWLFEVVFDYGEHNPDDPKPNDNEEPDQNGKTKNQWKLCRHDPFSTYRSGFEVRTYRLCQRVLMFHHFPEEEIGDDCLVRSTNLVYREIRGDLTDRKQGHPIGSFIASVTQSGYQRKAGGGYLKKSLPPLEFTYSEALINEEVQEIDAESLENLPYGLDGSRYQWVDLDGEGLSGILTEQGGAWFYKRNLSALPALGSGDKPNVAARFAPVECLRTMPGSANLNGGQQLIDLAGDGQLDVVEFDGPVPGFFERTTNDDWETFRSFTCLPNIDWNDPNLKFVDLTGDGQADVLITDNDVLTWYVSLGERGFGAAEKVRQTLDEEMGPRLVLADSTQSIYLSDLSGDGLSDLVRIRNGEVCYWPNLGYGRFGAKVTMDHAPWFDTPEQFDQRRIRLADIDGSGTIDIIYLGRDGVYLYFNRCGNSWSPARKLNHFPRTDNLSSVMTADLLGNGTACLVWSSSLPADVRRPLRYIDLMGGQKPHLLIKTVNNLGAETTVDYAPSTKFYLADKYAGRPWITKLPFPVHCVERVTITDKWRDTEFSTTYSYHHGYFDGVEREFRGFGRVEQVDTESYGKFLKGNITSPYITDDHTLYQPPIKTITWFHTGAARDGRPTLTQLQTEYFPNSLAALPNHSALLAGFNEKALSDPDLESQDLNADEWREALRACKGITLRTEVYELDVDRLEVGHQIPVRLFSAVAHNCHIRRVQPKGGNQHAVFLVTESEALTYNYELDLRPVTFPADPKQLPSLEPDPRVTHTLNWSFDEYGNVRQSIAVGYKRARLFDDADLTEHLSLIRDVQREQHVVYTETRYTGDAIEPKTGSAVIQHYRLRLSCEVQTCEITGVTPARGFYFDLSELQKYHWSDTLPDQGIKPVNNIEYQELPAAGPDPSVEKRKIEHVLTLFFSEDLKTPLGSGQLNHLGLTYEQYKLAVTKPLLQAVLGNKFDNQVQTAIDIPNTSGYWPGTQLLGPEGVDQWWMRSGVAGFSDDADQHFYLPERYTDPFGNITTLEYDGKYDLFIQASTDALGNRTGVFADQARGLRFDYRVLAPAEIEDINGNRTEACFDALGMVVAIADKGKGDEADNLDGYTDEFANPSLNEVLDHFDLQPLTADQAHSRFSVMLGNATSRFMYHFGEKIENGKTVWVSRPPGACAVVREQHVADVKKLRLTNPAATSPLQIAFECSDGMGAVLMKRSQAEPETAGGNLRWIVSGKTVLNNKGNPVKQYEPYFSARASCCAEGDEHEEAGVTSLMYYDAAGRLVRTEMPDGIFSRVEYSPWHVKSFDQNDTVMESRWYSERNPLAPEQALPRDAITNELSVTSAQRTAWLAAQHAGTPALTILDSLGREVISIAHNRVEDANGPYVFGGNHYRDDRYLTFTKLDAEGKPLWIRDARGNLVMQYITPPVPNDQVSDPASNFVPCYDIAGNLLFQHSMDGGDRWMLMDAAGKPMLAWDFNQRQEQNNTLVDERRLYVTDYDALHRPVATWLSIDDGAPQMGERFEYSDTKTSDGADNPQFATDKSSNLIGQLIRHYDPSGRVETVRRDFKGNVTEVRRRLNNTPAISFIDWQGTDATKEGKLETETFAQITEFDALNRMTRLYNWHRSDLDSPVSKYEPRYNERGLLTSELLTTRLLRKATSIEIGPQTKTTTAIREIRYNEKGQTIYLALGNGTVTTNTYDPETFRLVNRHTERDRDDTCGAGTSSAFVNGHVLQDLRYTYDPVGNITEIEDSAFKDVFFQNQKVKPINRYEYDALYRLVRANGRENGAMDEAPANIESGSLMDLFPCVAPDAFRNYTQTFRYDRVGNIEQVRHQAVTGSWTRDYAYAFDDPAQPASNRLWQTWDGGDRNEATTYLHDTHGNMLNLMRTDPRFNMRWDHRDMIASIDLGGGGTAFYQYDASRQRTRKRIEKQNNSNGYWERIYLGGYELYRRYSAANSATPVEEIESHHLFAGEQRVLLVDDVITASDTASPQTLFRYQYVNHLGSACLELDDQSEIISYEEYHPYGTSAYRAMKSGIEAPPKRYRYTGMERDEESGLSYHVARYYAPSVARWLSVDPKGLQGGLNVFLAYGSNPVSFVDPSGTQNIKAQYDGPTISSAPPYYGTGMVFPEELQEPHPEDAIANFALSLIGFVPGGAFITAGLRNLQIEHQLEYHEIARVDADLDRLTLVMGFKPGLPQPKTPLASIAPKPSKPPEAGPAAPPVTPPPAAAAQPAVVPPPAVAAQPPVTPPPTVPTAPKPAPPSSVTTAAQVKLLPDGAATPEAKAPPPPQFRVGKAGERMAVYSISNSPVGGPAQLAERQFTLKNSTGKTALPNKNSSKGASKPDIPIKAEGDAVGLVEVKTPYQAPPVDPLEYLRTHPNAVRQQQNQAAIVGQGNITWGPSGGPQTPVVAGEGTGIATGYWVWKPGWEIH